MGCRGAISRERGSCNWGYEALQPQQLGNSPASACLSFPTYQMRPSMHLPAPFETFSLCASSPAPVMGRRLGTGVRPGSAILSQQPWSRGRVAQAPALAQPRGSHSSWHRAVVQRTPRLIPWVSLKLLVPLPGPGASARLGSGRDGAAGPDVLCVQLSSTSAAQSSSKGP